MAKKANKKKRGHPLVYIFSLFLVVTLLGVFSILLTPICANSLSCTKDLSGNFDASATEATFLGNTFPLPSTLASGDQAIRPETVVLGDVSPSSKRIYVDLATQTLYAKEGDTTIFSFPVSTGKWGRTPTGDFTIWIKLRYTRMQGGSRALGTYYNLPNVPYTMFFYNDKIPKWRGFGIHGAYWHDNFGHPMSHGCINMRIEDVEKVYNWAEPPSTKHTTYATAESPGTPITIYGVAPQQ